MTERELAKMLQNNPDLSVTDGLIGIYETPQPSAVAYFVASEHDLQAAIIAECDRRALRNPLWGLIYAIPNGGHRHPAVAGKLKAEGVRASIPDLCCPLPRHGYGAAYIELKHGSNKPTAGQMEMIRKLQEAGNWAGVYWELDQTLQFLEWYVEGA